MLFDLRPRLILLLSVGLLIVSTVTAPDAQAANWRYVALGDSLAVGLWDSWEVGLPGYVFRYAIAIGLDTRSPVAVDNQGGLGWNSAQLLSSLRTSSVRDVVRRAQIVTWNIGGNDFLAARDRYRARTCSGTDNQDCLRSAVASFKTNWIGIMSELQALRNQRNTMLRTMNLYNPYVAVDQANNTWDTDAGTDFQVFKPYVDDLNAYMCSTANTRAIPCANVYTRFNGPNGNVDPNTLGYLSFDGLHPNESGHQAIADLLREFRYQPLSNK